MVSSGTKYKKKIFILGLLVNWGILFVFKYYNFINTYIFHLFSALKVRWKISNLDILLPIGISFYTIQAVGYSIDIYRGNIKAECNFFICALFISFFCQLLLGSIERAKNLLPQFREKHFFNCNQVLSGIKLMIWGYFMKYWIADCVALYRVYHHTLETWPRYIELKGSAVVDNGYFFTFLFSVGPKCHATFLIIIVMWAAWGINCYLTKKEQKSAVC